MKYFITLIMSCLILSGCVEVVNENDINELKSLAGETDQSATSNQNEQSKEKVNLSQPNDAVTNEETKFETFQEIIEDYILNEFPEPEEINQEESKIYYLALGDSLTRGVGDEEQKNGYTERLAEKIEQWTEISDVVLDNRGKRGRRSDQLLALLEKGHYDKELENSELITITIGGNDIMKIVKKDILNLKREPFDEELIEFEQRYDKIIQKIRVENPDVPIILIGLYNPFSVVTDEVSEFEAIISEWNNTIKTISERHQNACFVDVEDLFDQNANMVYHTDFFHPNGNGYTMMTERIISIMKACNIEEDSKGLFLFNEEPQPTVNQESIS
ncbi:GDSL-type esterase/lipase family protein [Lysinibacillus sp. BW-2-10]|uniref:GDSL-type esterase/lipase family protein n=1 Tax=Lysinibacillus sp. BW-2-10 TaxID=2590030 RepID=UPI0011801120|nr:GDSL-type esterase/lipase family protein [Lysinibacillus sp. BW-2-10]TSI02595.1 lysophospholipase [Lysinibacillus sp. BW-2-10]